MGYHPPQLKQLRLDVKNRIITLGSALEFSFSIVSDSEEGQTLMIDYIIHHQKANGSTAPKVFKWRSLQLAAHQVFNASKAHGMKKITTRQYYAGLHKLEIVVNGMSVAETDFQLIMPALKNT